MAVMQMGENFHNNSFDSDACICIWLHVVFQELTAFHGKSTQYTVNHEELKNCLTLASQFLIISFMMHIPSSKF